MTSIYDIIK